MTKKNSRKDYLNLQAELVSLKLVEDLKLKLTKSKTEFKMLFVQPELLSKKELLLVVDVPFSMLQEFLIL